MKRRQLVRYAGAGALTALGAGLAAGLEPLQAQTAGVTVQWLGHMAFLFSGDNQRILVNPFRSIGCTAKYRAPKANTDLVLISSQLLDEGAVEVVPGNPRLLYQPGVYQVGGLKIQGIQTDHDRLGGKRFGQNVAWQWKQGGLNILHLGGAAAPLSLEQKILMGRPDVLLLPVGGGPKAYTAAESKQAIQVLNPRLVIPTQFRTPAADTAACDLTGVEEFLTVLGSPTVRRSDSDTIVLRPADLPSNGTAVQVLSYRF
ncbi:MAG TPA: MBL fold metallo-hydrolase [Thermosynechococcaceae cyanobacterium]